MSQETEKLLRKALVTLDSSKNSGSYYDEIKACSLSAKAYSAAALAVDTEETWQKHRDAANANSQAANAQRNIDNKQMAEKHDRLAKQFADKAKSMLENSKSK